MIPSTAATARLRRAVAVLAWLLLAAAAAAAEDDVRCLRGVKDALSHPSGSLNWNFGNRSVAFVCSFNGVSCWNTQENRVLTLNLASSSLSGEIPSSLQYCSALNNLDLSNNQLSGSIPAELCDWIPYVVTLDLSGNQLSGPIPPSLSNCKFLNSLLLQGNHLSGQIPTSLSRLRLERLRTVDLSNNQLSGPIPDSLQSFDASAFAGNDGLCGGPLGDCGGGVSKSSLIIIIAAGVFGAAVSLLLAYAAWRWWLSPSAKRGRRMSAASEDSRCWAERLRSSHHRLVPVSLFQEPIIKVKFANLMAATADFNPDHIITAGSSRTGTAYRALLPDGSALTVKRLHDCPLPEKQFRSEMGRLGQLRHPNLVPLLGFCVVEDERLLVYKHMPNGPLSTAIGSLDWTTRLRIGVGAARGLAWLHHGFQVPFLHQSMSSNSILLDEDHDARVTDFDLVRLTRLTDTNRDFGELGYVAPEYATNPVSTTKGDVYAFGVVLLELATGQKPTEVGVGEPFKGSLVDWVNQLTGAGRIGDVVDKSLSHHDDEITKFLTIASGCVVARPMDRPSMSHVYDSLKSIGQSRDFSEQFDEFPLLYGKDD